MKNSRFPLDTLIIVGLIALTAIAYFLLSFQQSFITIEAEDKKVLGINTSHENNDKVDIPIVDVTPDVYFK